MENQENFLLRLGASGRVDVRAPAHRFELGNGAPVQCRQKHWRVRTLSVFGIRSEPVLASLFFPQHPAAVTPVGVVLLTLDVVWAVKDGR